MDASLEVPLDLSEELPEWREKVKELDRSRKLTAENARTRLKLRAAERETERLQSEIARVGPLVALLRQLAIESGLLKGENHV